VGGVGGGYPNGWRHGRGLKEPVGTVADGVQGLLSSHGGDALGITVGCEKGTKPSVPCVDVGLFFSYTCALYRTTYHASKHRTRSSSILINGYKKSNLTVPDGTLVPCQSP
jgi:hypothetical protein